MVLTRCCCWTSRTTSWTCRLSAGWKTSWQNTQKSVLLVSHDRELLAQAAQTIAVLELGAAGNSVWIHGSGFETLAAARRERFARLKSCGGVGTRSTRSCESCADVQEQGRLQLRHGLALSGRPDSAAKFEEAGPPQAVPLEQRVSMRLSGGRTGKRAIMVDNLELTGLMRPFDAEIWFGDRVAVLGSNGSGKSHFLRLLALAGPILIASTSP